MANYNNYGFKDGDVLKAEGLHYLEAYLKKCLDIVDDGSLVNGNLNLITTPGTYTIEKNAVVVNAPPLTNNAKLFVINGASGSTIQFIIVDNTIYYRTYTTSWTSWNPLASSLSQLGITVSSETINELSEHSPSSLAENKLDKTEAAARVKNPIIIGSKEFDGSEKIEIEASDLGLGQAIKFKGIQTSFPSDAANGDIIFLNSKEYIYYEGEWTELGDESNHVPNTRQIKTESGLTGGGNLTKDLSIKHYSPKAENASAAYPNAATTDNSFITQIKVDEFGHIVDTVQDTITDITADNSTTLENAITLSMLNSKNSNPVNIQGNGIVKVAADKDQNKIVLSATVDAANGDDIDTYGEASVTKEENSLTGEVTFYFHQLKGKPGQSVTHSWEGTTLVLNSASGTTRTDLKGDPGQFESIAIAGRVFDLNDCKTEGFYFCNDIASAASMTNCPIKTLFSLVVTKTDHDGCTQDLYSGLPSDPRRYFRHYKNGTWSEWYEEYNTYNKPTFDNIISSARSIGNETELNNAKKIGWYYYNGSTVDIGGAQIKNGFIEVITAPYQQVFQRLTISTDYEMCAAARIFNGETWGPWEWINAPFTDEIVYRMVERSNGLTVYRKRDAEGKYWYRLEGETEWTGGIPAVKALPGEGGGGGGDSSAIVVEDENDDGHLYIEMYSSDSYIDHLTDKNNPHKVTAEQIGAAPTGYGLGAFATDSTSLSDANTAIKSGWYKLSSSTANGIGSNCVIRVDSYGSNYCTQTAYLLSLQHNTFIQRQCVNGTWTEWEWANPPMMIDQEYRTTDRIEGKAVFKKKDSSGQILYRLDGETEWKVQAELMGAAPAGLTTGYYTASTDEQLDTILQTVLTSMEDRTQKVIVVYLDSTEPIFKGGTWFITINKINNSYSHFNAESYAGVEVTKKYTRTLFGGELKPWVRVDSTAFAPSGYGLGETSTYCTDCNNASKNGWYEVDVNTTNLPAEGVAGTLFVHSIVTDNGTDIYQTIKSGVTVIQRYYSSWAQAWQPWEWVNPPLTGTTEYRTTERVDGQAVYKRRDANGYTQFRLDNSDTWLRGVPGSMPMEYGLGVSDSTPYCANTNDAWKNGWYKIDAATNGGVGCGAIMRVDAYASAHAVCQTAYTTSYSSKYPGILQRWCMNGTWETGWAWVDPPKMPGIEYRTTERWNGMSVYTMLVNFGTLPNNTTKTVSAQASGVTNIIDISGVMHQTVDNCVGEMFGQDKVSHWVDIYSDSLRVGIVSSADLTGYTGYIVLKYVKA